MNFIIFGIIGFIFLFASDICGMKSKCKSRNLFALVGVLFVLTSSIIILVIGKTYTIGLSYRILAGTFTLVFLILLVYSVLIEVNKNNDPDNKLITTGTYALSRHPGVIWLLLYYVFGSLLFTNVLLLIAGIVWSIVNIIYVILQERLIFNKIFNDYDLYVETTPMLLPNINSIKKCINTLNGGQNERFTSDV